MEDGRLKIEDGRLKIEDGRWKIQKQAFIDIKAITEHNTNLKPTVSIKDKKDKKATLRAFPILKFAISSPIKAPTKGIHIIPQGGKNNPTIMPIVEPIIAYLEPPPSFVTSIGAK